MNINDKINVLEYLVFNGNKKTNDIRQVHKHAFKGGIVRKFYYDEDGMVISKEEDNNFKQ